MKKFIRQAILFCLISMSVFVLILSLADGYTDPFYVRFTTPKQENLILGTSRAAQGLQPLIFKNRNHLKIYNYAFTMGHSPFGEVYLNSIKNKLKKSTQDGVFIITVDPWSISSKLENPNDSSQFRELNTCLANTPFVDDNPNFFYLIKNLKGRYYSILTNKLKSPLFLHQNGWLEVSIDMNSVKVEKRIEEKIKDYREKELPNYKYSTLRYKYLKKTIEFLNMHGQVYLVRLPVHSKMMEIENELMPDFNNKIKSLTPLTKGYLDLTNDNDRYTYTDGNHLYKESGKFVSIEIAEWIKK